jgi:hypothetical protein
VYSTLTDRAHFLTISWTFPFSVPRRRLSWRAADRFPGARLPSRESVQRSAVAKPLSHRTKWIFHRDSEKMLTRWQKSARGRKIPPEWRFLSVIVDFIGFLHALVRLVISTAGTRFGTEQKHAQRKHELRPLCLAALAPYGRECSCQSDGPTNRQASPWAVAPCPPKTGKKQVPRSLSRPIRTERVIGCLKLKSPLLPYVRRNLARHAKPPKSPIPRSKFLPENSVLDRE